MSHRSVRESFSVKEVSGLVKSPDANDRTGIDRVVSVSEDHVSRLNVGAVSVLRDRAMASDVPRERGTVTAAPTDHVMVSDHRMLGEKVIDRDQEVRDCRVSNNVA